jgi:hypothetical protein
MPHPFFVLLGAVLLGIALAIVDDRKPRERLRAGARVFLFCIGAVAGGSWLMYLIHG